MSRHLGSLSLTISIFGIFSLAALSACTEDAPIQLIRNTPSGGAVNVASGGAPVANAGGAATDTGGSESSSGGLESLGGADDGAGGSAVATACGGPTDCPAELPVCAMLSGQTMGVCAECLVDNDCAADGGECDVVAGRCTDPGVGTGGSEGAGGSEGSGGSENEGVGGSVVVEPAVLITNGDFSQTNTGINNKDENPNGDGFTGWRGGDDTLDHTISAMGCVRWDATIGWDGGTGGVALEQGSYKLTFRVIATGDPWIDVKVAGTSDPFTPELYPRTKVEIAADSNALHSVSFSVSGGDAGQKVGLAFFVGEVDGQICLDDVVLEKN